MRIKAEVNNAELLRKLEEKKQKAIKSENIKASLRKGAEIGLVEAKSRVPVLTGALRDSLKIRTSGKNILIATRLKYATYQEFKNRSYLRATINEAKEEMTDSIKKEYSKITIG